MKCVSKIIFLFLRRIIERTTECMNRLSLLILFIVLHTLNIKAQTFPNYIAHGGGAGGAIGQYIYSNSKEALLQSIERGYTFIEIDMDTTSEGHLVASHDWKSFHATNGHPEWGDSIIPLETFKATRMYGRFTTISIDEVVEILLEHPSVFLVTDKISNVDVLDRSLSGIRDRVYVEAFSMEDFIRLREVGYHAMYSQPAENLAWLIVENLLDGTARIDFIADATNDNFKEISRLKCLAPFKVAMYTSNSKEFVDEHLGKEIDLIYTDYYNPQTGNFNWEE